MAPSLILVCVWVVLASLLSLLPSRRKHWPAAWVLIALGVPLLGYVTWQMGPVWGLAALGVGISVLRWPVIYLWRRVMRRG